MPVILISPENPAQKLFSPILEFHRIEMQELNARLLDARGQLLVQRYGTMAIPAFHRSAHSDEALTRSMAKKAEVAERGQIAIDLRQ